MIRTSCISHPPNNPYLFIQLWQVIACDGDVYAAALLSHIEARHNEKYGIDKHHKHVNDISEMHSNPRTLDENVLIPAKLPELRKALFGLAAEKKISECLDQIKAKGFINIGNNPDPNKILDRTKYISFYPEICNAWIREHYDNDGSLINQPCETHPIPPKGSLDSAKKESRFGEKAESIMPKGRIDSAKKENRHGEKAESENQTLVQTDHDTQVVDNFDNAEKESRFGEKAVSILPKGVSFNINQSIPININQGECENFDHTHENTQAICDVLIANGFSPGKFDYPDALPAIERLRSAGANLEMFAKAHEIAMHATKGKFGVNYLIKVVEGLLSKSQKNTNPILHGGFKNVPRPNTKPSRSQKEYVYENDLKNAESWAGDLI